MKILKVVSIVLIILVFVNCQKQEETDIFYKNIKAREEGLIQLFETSFASSFSVELGKIDSTHVSNLLKNIPKNENEIQRIALIRNAINATRGGDIIPKDIYYYLSTYYLAKFHYAQISDDFNKAVFYYVLLRGTTNKKDHRLYEIRAVIEHYRNNSGTKTNALKIYYAITPFYLWSENDKKKQIKIWINGYHDLDWVNNWLEKVKKYPSIELIAK